MPKPWTLRAYKHDASGQLRSAGAALSLRPRLLFILTSRSDLLNSSFLPSSLPLLLLIKVGLGGALSSSSDPSGFFSGPRHIAASNPATDYMRLTRIEPLTSRGRRDERRTRAMVLDTKYREAVKTEGVSTFIDPLSDGADRSPFGKMWENVMGTKASTAGSSKRPPSSLPKPRADPTSAGRNAPTPRFSRGVHAGQGFRLPSSPRPPPSSRSFSTTPNLSVTTTAVLGAGPVALKRAPELAARIPSEREVDLRQIMGDLRDLELLDMLREVKPKAAVGYRDATRALYPLFHKLDQGEIKGVSFADLQAALPPIFTIPWTHISERLLTGQVVKLDALTAKEKAQVLFLQIYNIGPARAWKYADAGCRTFEDLDRQKDSDKLKLSKAQKTGLLHRGDIGRLIPRAEMEKLKTVLEKALQAIDPRFECEILGSYRRGIAFSADIDLAVRHPDFVDKDDEATSKPMMQSIVKYLEKHKLIEKENHLMLGPKKYAGLIRLPRHKHFRRIDIRLAPNASFPYMLLGSSGDALLMKLLRHVAKEKGMCLNEYGMGDKYSAEDQNPNGFKPGTMRVVKSEEEIFKLLGMPFLKPEEREYSIWKEKYATARVPAVESLHRL
ncbi:hypothetical protein JCM11641_003048 [Rhodosporidiobolus odoratus]